MNSIEQYNQMIDSLTERGFYKRLKPEIAVDTRENFGEGTKIKLVEFVENFVKENDRPPTIMEIAEGAKSSTASIKKYLKEGTDFTVASKLEAAKLGGKKSGAKRSIGTTKVISPEIYDEFKNLQVKGLSTGIDVSKTGSIEFRLRFDKKLKLKDLNLPATPENLEKVKLKINEVVNSKKYKDNIKPFQTPEDQRKIKREKYAQYKEQDPFRVYEQLQDYKAKKFPGTMSKEVQIQHGQPKFTTQTLSRFGLIPADVNVDPNVEKIEGIRNELVKNTRTKLNNPSRSLTDKKNIVEQFNNVMKGLRGQLKGTKGQGLVNFELFDIDEKGNIRKLKDTGFDPKKGMAYKNKLGELDLSKITRAEADKIVNLGKSYIDRDFIKRTVDVTTADKIKRPEKAELMDMYRDAFKGERGFVSADLLKDVGKGAGKLLTAAGTPLGIVGVTAGVGVDPTSAIDRVALGAEAALAPSLVKGTSQLTKNALLQKLFNLGLSPKAAMRVARIASPLGIASLGGEALYQYGKFVKDELERIENMTPEEREAYNIEQEEQMGIAAANGGLITRQAFKDGFDPKKRKTVKLLGGLASIPVLGKYLKILGPLATTATETIKRGSDGIPDFIKDLIAKVKLKAEATGMKYFTGKSSDEFADVYQADDYVITEKGNNITIRKTDDPDNPYYKEIEMEIETDPETGGIIYKEATARPDGDGKLKDIEEYIEDVDLEDMKKYTYDE